jgi:predicted component of type VI protein secretion system
LLTRVQELEENEEVLRERVDQAAKLGAKWMEEKKDRELAERDAEHAQALALALKDAAAKFDEELQRRTAEVATAEKRAKVNALRGQEDSLSKRHQEEVARLTAQIDQMMLSLEQGDRKIKQLEKVLKLRG